VRPADDVGVADSGLQVRITAGGTPDATEQAAIVTAVSRVVKDRDAERARPASAWSLAGRLEASGATTVRWRGALPRGSGPLGTR
jgi:hypothetical protein